MQVGPEDYNIVFHIYSVEGRMINAFLGFQSLVDIYAGKTVLFPSGSEFMVCKVDLKDNVKHIYLRNIPLGLKNEATVVFWVDEKVHSGNFSAFNNLISMNKRKMAESSRQDT